MPQIICQNCKTSFNAIQPITKFCSKVECQRARKRISKKLKKEQANKPNASTFNPQEYNKLKEQNEILCAQITDLQRKMEQAQEHINENKALRQQLVVLQSIYRYDREVGNK